MDVLRKPAAAERGARTLRDLAGDARGEGDEELELELERLSGDEVRSMMSDGEFEVTGKVSVNFAAALDLARVEVPLALVGFMIVADLRGAMGRFAADVSVVGWG